MTLVLILRSGGFPLKAGMGVLGHQPGMSCNINMFKIRSETSCHLNDNDVIFL